MAPSFSHVFSFLVFVSQKSFRNSFNCLVRGTKKALKPPPLPCEIHGELRTVEVRKAAARLPALQRSETLHRSEISHELGLAGVGGSLRSTTIDFHCFFGDHAGRALRLDFAFGVCAHAAAEGVVEKQFGDSFG